MEPSSTRVLAHSLRSTQEEDLMARSTKKVKPNDNKEDSGGEVGQKENVNPNLPSDSGKDVVEGAKNLALRSRLVHIGSNFPREV